MGEPERITHRDITPGQPRQTLCSECEKHADRLEQEGHRRPETRPARDWEANGKEYRGALCLPCSNAEHCRAYLAAREKLGEQAPKREELERRHRDRLAELGWRCVCTEVLKLDKMAEEHRKKKLHPCSKQNCGRWLVYGVGTCWECKQKANEARRLGEREAAE
jgi:hypothetical protein